MRGKRISKQRRAARLASLSVSLGAAATLLSTAFCGQAQAADGPSAVPDYQGARQVLQSTQVHNTVAQFLSTTANGGADGGSGAAAPMATEPPDGQQTFTLNAPVALYELAPDFVTGKAKPTPDHVVRLSHLASLANGTNGHKATVLLSSAAKSGGKSWHLAGVRDGDSDVTYARQAAGPSTVFTEPQIHAWYRLKNNTVEPLNREAASGLRGKQAVTLDAYQKLVHDRYADKLPGSAYDRKGLAGGYGLASPPSTPMLLGGSSAAAAVLAGGTIALLRAKRRRSQVS
ncbi:hypothetical protein GCM10010211_73800 [Streptomyces albospinus]|uniref:Uncharacterized protein n=1 Tax=Streptomyces albospinus TaxID=285515 RepID=A0ABQ2VL89_9ACTN|nr:hypothetical protein [Streptomyces albospinus]GGU95916.1 hypothetical protein GCM10010211_73800 [Streptomyces albospinus]